MPKTWKDNVLSAIADAPTGVASLAAIKKATGVTASNRRFFDGALAKLVEEGALIKVKASYKLVAKKSAPKAAEPKPTKPKNQTDQTKRKSAPAPPPSEDADTASADSMDDEPLQIGECAVVPGSGSYYEVTRDSAIQWHCTCKSFKFAKKANLAPGEVKSCKHIDGLRDGSIEPLDVTAAPAPLAKPKATARGAAAGEEAAADVASFSFGALKITIPELKACLRANDQLLSGNKDELCARVDERFANGALGRCTECGGGHYHLVGTGPRWQCKGYHDGDEFHWCSASTTMPARGPFKVPEELKTKFGIPTGPSEASTSTSAGPSTTVD